MTRRFRLHIYSDITADGTFCPKCGNDNVSPFNNGFCNKCGADVENGYNVGTIVDREEAEAYIEYMASFYQPSETV